MAESPAHPYFPWEMEKKSETSSCLRFSHKYYNQLECAVQFAYFTLETYTADDAIAASAA